LSAYEAGRLALMFEPAIKEEARERQISTLKQGNNVPDAPTLAQREEGRSRDKIAEIAGLSHFTKTYPIRPI
jgi:hypothetical protein